MRPSFDYLVIGQGLAGTLCSFELLLRGKRVRVIDSMHPYSASRVAAGLMSPVSGQRTALLWHASELVDQARETYHALEKRLGRRFYFPLPLLRIYTDGQQRQRFRARSQETAYKNWLGAEWDPTQLDRLGVHAPLGGRVLSGAGWLDCAGLLSAWRDELKKMGVLEEGICAAREFEGARVVACTGLREMEEGLFEKLKFQPTKGELLEIQSSGADQGSIFYASHFAIPLGSGRWKIGATYDRADLTEAPTSAGLATLSAGAGGLFKSTFSVTGRHYGLRPNLLGHFPVLGATPGRPTLFAFNGLGSKGALWGPTCARILVEHMEDGKELPAALDVNRFR